MAKHYNFQVQHRDFQVEDLVLRKSWALLETPHKGSSAPIGKDFTKSPYGRERALTNRRC